MARVTYNREHFVPENWINEHETRIVVRQQIEAGVALRICVGFQVKRFERWIEVVRYDDAHGKFHRHAPGIPPDPKVRELIACPAGSEVWYATDDLRANGARFLNEALAHDFEILEDADDDESTGYA